MWSDIFSAVKQIFVLNEQTQLNKEDIKELSRSFKELEDKVNNLSSWLAFWHTTTSVCVKKSNIVAGRRQKSAKI